MKKDGNGIEVRKSPKAMEKLKTQIKCTKEILNTNNEAPLSVESIYKDRDFRSTITQQKFEEICGDLFEEALLPEKKILKHSGLKVEDHKLHAKIAGISPGISWQKGIR